MSVVVSLVVITGHVEHVDYLLLARQHQSCARRLTKDTYCYSIKYIWSDCVGPNVGLM